MLRKGSRIGKYTLEKRLGWGAFSQVWRATDSIEGHKVALKIASPAQVKRASVDELAAEVRIAGRLNHPHVLRIYNADLVDGYFVIASALAERSLADYKGAWRSGRIALRVIRDVASGLAYAHARHVMHRDVKPENIVIFKDGRAALADFGVSRLVTDRSATHTGAGTLGYMAPEQAYSRPRLASDVFSLGLIAYEILTGELPKWPFEWPPPGLERFEAKVPPAVRPVLRKAAEFDPRRRFPDGVALHSALEAAFAKEAAQVQPKPRRGRRTPPLASPLEIAARAFARRHGRALGLRCDCRRCRGPIAEEMAHCPWCGTDDNTFQETTRYPLVCPDCEHGVLPEWTACPWCYEGRLEGNGRPPRPDPKALRRCTRKGCSGELRPFMRYCPICKAKVRRPWTHEALPDRCPRCRGPVSLSYFPYCPWCGRHEPSACQI